MGKTSKANRTKGNTRPSSSEHSAHLLTLSGKSFSGFVGFDSLEKDIPSYIPVTGQHSSDVDLSVDSDLRMVMRKMLKRDSVTRLKAVQEFGDLCAEKDKDTVKNVLPFWPRLFNKLALDHDRRIREATHQANEKLIANVKREIAPYLKNIMGVWLLGQNDLHAPAASAAQNTFINTFPKNKQSEALMHCKNEIFSLFKDNLFEQTAKTMSDPNSTSAEDVESKYTLVISATLQAVKLFLVTVSSNEISNIQDDLLPIISDNKFWKYSKAKEPQIRGSWYTLISFLCHVKPDIFAEMEKKLVSAVFCCLSESDPIVAPAVWESTLHLVVNFENCWQGINIQKVVLPQLWTLLNEGGKGSAHIVYPCILPFLSKFPKDIIAKETFLLQFFACLKQSLLLDSVKLSSMECDAILTTFMECLQYISFCILESAKDGSALLEKVLSDHVLPLVDMSFYESKYCHLATSKLYSSLGSLVQKIESKCMNSGEEESKAFSPTLTLFWNSIYSVFCKIFDKKEEERVKTSVYITYFFHSIFTSSDSVKIQKSKVRFADETEPEDASQGSPDCLPAIDLYKKMPLTFMHIIKFIKTLCSKTDENINLCYLKILDEILASTLNAEYLKDILKSYEESCDIPQKASLTFFNKVILNWVSVGVLDESSVTYISDIVFSLCSSVSEDEALEMLNICCEVKNPIFIEGILRKGLSVYVHERVMQNWLRSPILIECILSGLKEMMESLTNDEKSKDEAIILAHKNILLMCLVNNDLQETLRLNKSMEEILVVCKDFMLKGLNCKNVDSIIQISCSIIKEALLNYKDCWSYSITDELLLLLFNWKLHAEEFGFSGKICSTISDVWNTAIFLSYKNNAVTKNDSFVLRATKELNSSLCNLPTSKKASKTFYEILNLLHTVKDVQSSLPDNYSSYVLSELLENILPSDFDWQKLREGLVFSSIPSILERKFVYNSHTENCNVSQEDVHKLFMATKVVSQIFTEEIDKCHSCEDEQYFEQYVVKHVPNLLWCLSYCSGNGFMSEDSEIKLDIDVLDEHCMKILKFISYEKLEVILKDMFYCSLSKGLFWALPFQLLIETMKQLYAESIILFDELISEASMMESDYVSLNVQILSHHVSKEKKVFYLKNLLGDLTENCDNQCKEINDEYLTKLGEICCFIQDSEAIDEEVKNLLSVFFTMFSSLSECPKNLSLFYLEFVSLMSSLVQYTPSLITRNSWCFMQTFLSSYIKMGKSKNFDKPDDLLFLFQVSLAYSTSFSFICASEEMEMSWAPSVSDELNEGFISLFIHYGGVVKKFCLLPQAFEIALNSLLKAIEYIPENVLFNYVMQCCEAECCESDTKEDKSVTPLDNLLSILLSDIPQLQLSAHFMLLKIMPLLSESISNTTKCECDDNEDEEEKVPEKLLPLVDTLNILNDLMESMLYDIKIGECCLVLPNTEPYAFVSAYFFTWLQMLEFISASPSQVRSGYVAHLEEKKMLSSLLSNLCRLMPDNPMTCLKTAGSGSPKKENLISLFLHVPKISTSKPSPEEIQSIACYVFCTAMRKVPASVRTWWNNLDKKSADIVNKFTSKYISGILCAEEIQAVQNNENLFKNMVVKARLGSREVIATYAVDDFTIELYVQLSTNYPLGPITAEKRGKIVIDKQEWRHWLMQLTTVLNYQNGSILDGLNIWKKNLDKKFEGVEECMICYYILHSSSMKLPKVSCNTCRKKFHSACLYKWFHSINNSKCPLCRNEFSI